jgi:hypothetical protein
MDLAFTIAAGPRQRSHSQIRVPRDSWSHFTVSDSRLPQPEGPGQSRYIPRNRVAQLYLQALGSFFVASYDSQSYGGGIRPRLHTGLFFQLALDRPFRASGRIKQKITFPNNTSIVIEVCLPRRCIETTVLLLVRACSFPPEHVYRVVA